MESTLVRKRRRQFFWRFFIAIATLCLLARIYFRVTDDFRIANMTYAVPFHAEWEIPDPTREEKENIDRILSQKFHYIGKGAQSYAFASEDEQYVLKFFKFKHLKPSLFVDLLPPVPFLKEYKESQSVRKRRKLDGVFAGYRLGYDVHKPESGLLYIHLNPLPKSLPNVIVKDKIGIERSINLNDVVFVLQEKAKTTRMVVNEALKEKNIALARHRIGQIFDLYRKEYGKGIYDKDHGVMHNTGFVGDTPIHLDIGKLTAEANMKEPEYWQPDMELIAHKFRVWIHSNYPELYPELAKDIEAKVSAYYGKPFHF